MLIEKGFWDVVSAGPRAIRAPNPLWDFRVKENRMEVGKATRIIQEGVIDDLFNSIIDSDEPRLMWEKLRSVCSQTGLGVVYSIPQEPTPHIPENRSTERIPKVRHKRLF